MVEVDAGSLRNKHIDEVKRIKKRLKMRSWGEHPQYSFFDFSQLLRRTPFLRYQSNALISKFPLKDIKHHYFSKGFKDVLIEASIYCPEKVTLLLAHLPLKQEARDAQLKEIINIVKNIHNPIILMGDFNTFRGLEELSELMASTSLKDSVPLDEEDKIYTYPVWHPNRRLDYILVSKDIKVKKFRVLKAEFSDHLPLLVDFKVRK